MKGIRLLLVVSAMLAPALPAAALEGEGKPPAPAPAAPAKRAKVREFLGLLRWKDCMLAELEAGFENAQKVGTLPAGFTRKFRELADMKGLEDIAAAAWEEVLDEQALDGTIAFLKTEAGRKYAEGLTRMPAQMQDKILPWAMENAGKVIAALAEEGPEEGEEEGPPLRDLREAKRSANETAAIASLRNLATCQAQVQTTGKIDCDRDGIGEHGTILEMTGSVPVRAGFTAGTPASGDFATTGTKVVPQVLSSKFADVDGDGIVVKGGYCFRVYLPDSASPSGFVHEAGTKEKPALAGGSGRVGVDMAEVAWCAYAWPEKLGHTGDRVFFVNQAGDVLQSMNGKAKWEGKAKPVRPDAAFLGAGITAPLAFGTAGRDGDVWSLAN